MIFDYSVLSGSEKVTFALRTLYSRQGFAHYRMSKFEEYDLYSKNKDFLVSDNVITFTDTNGRLMALKPDVTLSIIKNQADEPSDLKKLCYNENVYRVSPGTGSFREIMQSGVECIGRVDRDCVAQVLTLAADSLALFGRGSVLEISNMDILSIFLDGISEDPVVRKQLLKFVSEKNTHEMKALCRKLGAEEEKSEALEGLMSLYGKPGQVFPRLKELAGRVHCSDKALALTDEFDATLTAADPAAAENFRIDFSLVDDMNYYNGIVFKGFLEDVPDSVLSGGQYDSLMRRMNRKSSGIGFAVYLEALERIQEELR